MKTTTLRYSKATEKKIITRAVSVLSQGNVVVFPTETVYGIGASALQAKAVKKIFKAKGRPSDNPLIVHVASDEQLRMLVSEIPDKAKQLIKKFWPGALTIIFRKSSKVPMIVTANLDTVAVRMPSHSLARVIIQEAGPVAAPSANISGRPSGTTARHIIEDLQGKVDLIIDGGKSLIGIESTVIDVTVEPPIILRPGYITKEQLERVIGKVLVSGHKTKVKSPGMKYSHYSPKAQVIVVEGKKRIQIIKGLVSHLKNTSVISLETKYSNTKNYVSPTLRHFAQHLFHNFRECDSLGIRIIIVEGVSEKGIGHAIMNRARKAAVKIVH